MCICTTAYTCAAGFDANHVMHMVRCHDSDTDTFYCTEIARLRLTEYPYSIVLKAGEGNLLSAIHHDHFIGANQDKVCQTFTEICQSVQHVHSKGYIHGNINPFHIIRDTGVNGNAGKLKLTDFASAVSYVNREVVGIHRYTELYVPPEMVCYTSYNDTADVKVDSDDATAVSDALDTAATAEIKPVVADTSYDIW